MLCLVEFLTSEGQPKAADAEAALGPGDGPVWSVKGFTFLLYFGKALLWKVCHGGRWTSAG